MAIERILPITGYRDLPVPNRLRQPAESAGRVALLLPGFGYTLDMPLFYYIENLCLDRGFDVLRVETAYSQNSAFADATEIEQARWVAADAQAAWQAGLAQANYASAVVAGKSLGAMAMAALLAEPLPAPQGGLQGARAGCCRGHTGRCCAWDHGGARADTHIHDVRVGE